MAAQPQLGILRPLPKHARYLEFSIGEAEHLALCLARLPSLVDGVHVVAGLGPEALDALDLGPPGRRAPDLAAPGSERLEAMGSALWLWLRGGDPGQLLHQTAELERLLAPGLQLRRITDAFEHLGGRDLSGYEDGTENPTGHKARRVALMPAVDGAYRGSSWVAVQRWHHDFAALRQMRPAERDLAIGRSLSDNEELVEAPTSAHVRRAAQERFTPEAFVLRRSMPWSAGRDAGLMFVAFGRRLEAFETLWAAMTGRLDGTVDQLFRFTAARAVGYYWCPPLVDGRLWLGK